jgi:hypothetical protein
VKRKRGPALPAAELARDPASVQLQQLRERLSVHADKLPPDLYDGLQKLISQAQADAAWMRESIRHARWLAVYNEIAKEKRARPPTKMPQHSSSARPRCADPTW